MNKSTLIERLRIGVAGFPMIAEHPSLLMTEAADRLEELDAQLIAAEELNDDQAHRLGKAEATIEAVRGLFDDPDAKVFVRISAVKKALEKHS